MTKRRWFVPALAALILASTAVVTGPVLAGGLPCRYDVTAVIDSPFADDIVRGEAINNHNEVCGSFTVGFGNDRAFYWTPQGGFIAIPTPAGVFESVAHDISDAGLVVGVMRFTGSAIGNKGFIHDIRTGQTTLLSSENTPGQCEITGVNEAGVVCGFRSVDDGGDPFAPTTAFRWSAKTGFEDMTPAGSSVAWNINEKGQCAGWIAVAGVQRGLRWNLAGYEVMPSLAGGWTESLAINDAGVMTGFSRIPWPGKGIFGLRRWATWQAGEIEDTGALSSYDSSIGLGVNTVGSLAGTSGPFNGFRAFVVESGVMRDLNQFNGDVNRFWTAAVDINDHGVVLLDADIGLQSLAAIYAPQTPVTGDADGNCAINVDDLLMVINQWGAGASSPADLDESGLVDVHDLILVLDHWTFGQEKLT